MLVLKLGFHPCSFLCALMASNSVAHIQGSFPVSICFLHSFVQQGAGLNLRLISCFFPFSPYLYFIVCVMCT